MNLFAKCNSLLFEKLFQIIRALQLKPIKSKDIFDIKNIENVSTFDRFSPKRQYIALRNTIVFPNESLAITIKWFFQQFIYSIETMGHLSQIV